MTPNPSNSSTADWPEPDVLHEELERWGRNTAAAEPRVVRVGYVQSENPGEPPGSGHLDIVLLVEDFDLPPAERIGMWDLGAVPVPAQTLVYTDDEWSELQESGSSLGQRLKDGTIWVYER